MYFFMAFYSPDTILNKAANAHNASDKCSSMVTSEWQYRTLPFH